VNELDGRRVPRINRYGPTARTVTLSLLGLLSGLTMVVVAFAGLHDAQRASSELQSHSLPASSALKEAITHGHGSQAAFLEATQTEDPATRSAALAKADAVGRRQAEAWTAYERVAIAGRDERALAVEYRAASEQGRLLAASVLSLRADDPERAARLARERQESSRQIAALASLASRYASAAEKQAAVVRHGVRGQLAELVLTYGFLAVLFAAVGVVLLRGAQRDQRQLASEAEALRIAGTQAAFEGALQRGLQMAPTEEASFDIVEQALSMVTHGGSCELLLADSSRSHLRQVLCTDAASDAACAAGTPNECPAVRSGQTRVFPDSTALDTCRFLRGRPDPAWAVCVPLSIAGQATGVVRVQQPRERELPARLVPELELVAQKAGERISALRVLARTEAQAQADPLTGLPNRRTLEAEAREHLLLEDPYVVLFADLDHFKLVNDTHGHETGDRALRLFARVLRDNVRPGDLIARYGGEEFVAVLPTCTVAAAQAVAERVRDALATALGHGTVPPFTVTVGVAASDPADELADVIARADAAMLRAKSLGRDRVLVADRDECIDCERASAALAPT
jgi:diguanylate cyclase (GGDEF)-like protein